MSDNKKEIYLPISCDFSLTACNYMLNLAKENNLGSPIEFSFNTLQEKQQRKWWLQCENGIIISDSID